MNNERIFRNPPSVEALTRRIQKLSALRTKWKNRATAFRDRLLVLDETGSDGRHCGCYLLLKAGAVVYVGQSINVFGRITNHRSPNSFPTAGNFDEAHIVWCSAEQLNSVEAALIAQHQPELNRAGVTSHFLPRCPSPKPKSRSAL